MRPAQLYQYSYFAFSANYNKDFGECLWLEKWQEKYPKALKFHKELLYKQTIFKLFFVKGLYVKDVFDWGMFISTALMAIFALFSWQTALSQKKSQEKILKEQQKSQEDLLNKQNAIQQRQLYLSLLKEKQEIRENFRMLIIGETKKFEEVIYRCNTINYQDFRSRISQNYVTIMRMRDLFGLQFEHDVKDMIYCFEKIISWETNRISELRLFENGIVHEDREKGIPEHKLKEYRELNQKNVRCLLDASEKFQNIMDKMNKDIDDITQEFHIISVDNGISVFINKIPVNDKKVRIFEKKFLLIVVVLLFFGIILTVITPKFYHWVGEIINKMCFIK
jgi:hypothetical protein